MNEKNKESKKPKLENKPAKNPVKRLTRFMLFIISVFFILYVLSDRYTPYSQLSVVKGLSIPIYPRVSGYITKINVELHSQVKKGDTLFQLDQRPFILAVQQKEAQLENTLQTVGAQTATVKSATGRLGMAKAQLDRAQRNYNRVQKVINENPGALSLADKDAAETALSAAVEQVTSAEADLEKAEQQLGISGSENAKYRTALVALEQAQLNLQFTNILAPADGAIESFNVDLGYYSQAGQPLAMFVSSTDYWIEAAMKENNISLMEVGDEVEFTFDVDPGKVYTGKVRSIGFGVNSGNIDRSSLPSPKQSKGWLRDPQRFPVIITCNREEISSTLRLGGQADVVVYTGESSILELLAKARIRLNSYLSYLR